MTVTIPGWEGSIGPVPGYGRAHVYARDTRSGAGNCVCGGALGDWRHVQAAPGVPVPDVMRPAGAAPFACSDCGRISHNPNDKAASYCGWCHGWRRDLLAPEPLSRDHLHHDFPATLVLGNDAYERLVADLDLPARPSRFTALLKADPAAVVRAVSEHAVASARDALAAARQPRHRLPRPTIELALAGSKLTGGWGLDWLVDDAVHHARIATSHGDVHDTITLIVSACGLTEPWDRPTPSVRARSTGPALPWPDVSECGFCLTAEGHPETLGG